MPNQFTIYRSTDTSAPQLFGVSGSLLTVLTAVLVNGYGSQTAAGWSLPLGASGANIVAYKQGAGAGFSLMVNDNNAGTGGAKEALVCGYQVASSEGTNTMGTGTGQFPTTAQLNTVGAAVVRKSSTADTTNARPWIIFADTSTMYMFIQTGDTAGMYYGWMFGDFFSLAGAGSADLYRCAVIGRRTENSSSADTTTGGLDLIQSVEAPTGSGAFLANTLSGVGGAQIFPLVGDVSKTSYAGAAVALAGVIPCPNPYDKTYYISPIFVTDNGTFGVRGMLRGLYHICHATANFSDGTTFSGANDYAGKTFMVLVKGPSSGMFCMETSATLNTN